MSDLKYHLYIIAKFYLAQYVSIDVFPFGIFDPIGIFFTGLGQSTILEIKSPMIFWCIFRYKDTIIGTKFLNKIKSYNILSLIICDFDFFLNTLLELMNRFVNNECFAIYNWHDS